MIDLIKLDAKDAKGRGHIHGEHLRDKIHELYKIRLELTLGRTDFGDEKTLLQMAQKHLPIVRSYDADLYDELVGISEGANLGLDELVVLNHYTDLRDLSKNQLDDGGCSVLYSPGGVFGQTWDMHGSATDYVCLLDFDCPRAGRTMVFTIAGCVGMTGLTAGGLGMTINNLNSTDARIGLMWPVLVRACLKDGDAKTAYRRLLGAPIGSGHHYVVADRNDFYGLETSGTKKKLIQEGTSISHLHTNHCLDDEMGKTAVVSATSSTYKRYDALVDWQERGLPKSARELFDGFACVSNPQKPSDPHGVATCGAFVMDLGTSRVLACQGPPGPDAEVVDAVLSEAK